MRILSRLLFIALFLLPPARLSAQTPSTATRLVSETADRLKTFTLGDAATISLHAEAGDAEAEYWLGQIYEDGRLVKKDDELARKWIEKSADQYFGAAEYAMLRWAGRDRVKEELWLRRAAEDGEAHAGLWLAVAYRDNKFGTTDPVEAAKWFRMSAEQGDPDAQVSLGDMYDDGECVEQNYALAAEWYRKAAEHFPDRGGAGQGRNRLGQLYLEGLGVPKDYVLAYMWLALAGPSNPYLEEATSHMSAEQVQFARQLAELWLKGHPDPYRKSL
jgi:TPR repeat protein